MCGRDGSAQLLNVIHGDPTADRRSITFYSCAIFERGEYALDQFLKKNRKLTDIRKLAILHELLLAVQYLHNEKGARRRLRAVWLTEAESESLVQTAQPRCPPGRHGTGATRRRD